MNLINNLIILIKRPWKIIIRAENTPFKCFIPSKLYLTCVFKERIGRYIKWNNLRSYNEKLQWLKIYDNNPIYCSLVDKYIVKDYVSRLIGEEYVIPTIGIWETFEDIEFETLPNEYVLKCTHDSGGLVLCQDKSKFDLSSAERTLTKSLNRNYYYYGREWPYKRVKPRIIAEPYLEDNKYGELRDYKFFCFNGEPRIMFVAANRQSKEKETTFDFFDMDYNHLTIINGHPNSDIELDKPEYFELMKELARKLSKDIPHVRIDFYEVNGRVYFGEYTFYHYSGFTPFEPEEWDYILGDMINLPNKQ